jgi:hypothetical protein
MRATSRGLRAKTAKAAPLGLPLFSVFCFSPARLPESVTKSRESSNHRSCETRLQRLSRDAMCGEGPNRFKFESSEFEFRFGDGLSVWGTDLIAQVLDGLLALFLRPHPCGVPCSPLTRSRTPRTVPISQSKVETQVGCANSPLR